ncbi:unnamed protein product [Parascedosporium putredinis]|uniref:FAD/NAD(P)-binding domain-containing protein n=1 Tax=Parascedosporium putredinis TaxID=1442378 RepID=A0A9P1H8W3_9PEZI|nr:unnamed protein product [Parascedosporium putredinis]CAI8002477.1 unnamed protein product [Parascedosporium putredinis]
MTQPQQQRILVVGSGFAGMWSALSARRLLSLESANPSSSSIEVAVVAPNDNLVIRPRLYEPGVDKLSVSLGPLFTATGVRFIQGTVDAIDTATHAVTVVDAAGERSSVSYTRLVLAAGSRVVRPNIPGLAEHAFNVDQIDEATRLEKHLASLAALPASPARNTVVVCGGGFTGIELATELTGRLRATLGDQERLGTAVSGVEAGAVLTADGERIETLTAIWTAGMVANPLTAQISAEKDGLGRLVVDTNLRVPSVPDVFATGDVARAITDDEGHATLMSCQHAMYLGRFSGNNAAADLLGVAPTPYAQEATPRVMMSGAQGKTIKTYINRVLIYPPTADPKDAFNRADPEWRVPPLTDELLAGGF